MNRCIELALCGQGSVSPNPMVGAVIVCDDKIIGEGYHHKCGEPHAEVNAINSVKDISLLKKSTIYVSLEPCAHYGKTPPCADLIISMQIPRVVVGSVDPFAKVNGKGIEKLKNAGINVEIGVLKEQCDRLNKRFFTFHTQKRPYIILKWAQTLDGFIDKIRTEEESPLRISSQESLILSHKWRTHEDAILVGRNTVTMDNPSLTARLYKGKNPIRVCIDRNLSLNAGKKIFNADSTTIIFNELRDEIIENLIYKKIDFSVGMLSQMMSVLYEQNVQSLIVEGGRQTLETFINAGLWDEARVFTSESRIDKGIPAPIFDYESDVEEFIGGDSVKYFFNNEYDK